MVYATVDLQLDGKLSKLTLLVCFPPFGATNGATSTGLHRDLVINNTTTKQKANFMLIL